MTQKEAEVILKVNSKEAEDKIGKLETKAKTLRKRFEEAVKIGDEKEIKKVTRELKRTDEQLQAMRTNAANIRAAMKRLDEASPKDLKRTITLINKELESGRVRRGSAEWDTYVNALKAAKAELKKVNDELALNSEHHKTWKQRIKEWQTAIVGAVAGVVQGISWLKGTISEFVDSFVSMDGEMANVKKYTGMAGEEVNRLNEAFKEMDTRSSREELNKLAQDAGRLGKQSVDDVLGFVRAADQINVALDDLGEGATLTLSKLTGVFGVEKVLGTEKSLLSVGSVINELSQNCAASAPYLADFASRVGGVGAQAGMTVQQIMGIASVLDANNQALERSSTALANFISHLYTDPAKYAKAAGIGVKEFTDLLSRDANAAIIKFLEAANKMGGMEALAPVFADLGEKGSGMIATLSTLAANIDMVKSQQEAANIAFDEATSITAEFNVQNTTAAAQLDKAKKRASEMAVALGEQLYPVMMYCVEGSTMMLKTVSTLVSFFAKHSTAILSTAAAVATYTVAVNAAAIATKAHSVWVAAATAVKQAWAAANYLAAAATAAFTGNVGRASVAMAAFNRVCKANVLGIILSLLAAVTTALIAFSRRTDTAAQCQKKLAQAEEDAAKNARKEMAETDALYKRTQDLNASMKSRIEAAERLKKLHPDTFGNLTAEAIVAGKAAAAYNLLAENITKTAKASAYRQQLSDNAESLAQAELARDKILEQLAKNSWVDTIVKQEASEAEKIKQLTEWYTNQRSGHQAVFEYRPGGTTSSRENTLNMVRQLIRLSNSIDSYNAYANKLSDKILSIESTVISPDGAVPEAEIKASAPRGESEKERKAREKAEREAARREKEQLKKDLDEQKAIRERALTEELTLYRTGEVSYTEHEEKKYQIECDYIDRQLEVYRKHGLEESSDYAGLLRKKEELTAKHLDRLTALSLREIDEAHQMEVDNLTASLFDVNNIMYGNERAYRQAMLEETVYYLRQKQKLYVEDSDEWYNIERQIAEAVAKDQLDKQKETAQALRKFEEQYRQSSGSERHTEELAILDSLHDQKLISEEEYLKAKKAINDKYLKEDRAKASSVKSEYTDMVSSLYDAFTKLFESVGKGGQDMWNDLSDAAAASYAVMGAVLSQYSAYANAERDLEIAKIEKRYDTEIKAAGKNQKKVSKLEEQKTAEIAKTKKKYNDRAMKIELAQALAQTAQAAIAAYASASAIPVTGWIMGPIAAALATAAGLAQVAIIKKQHEAEAAGYYSGGFTARAADDRKAVGEVHANEFVVNSRAVRNPALSPLLHFIDRAQRNNTVATITSEDVSNAIGQGRGVGARAAAGGRSAQGAQPVINNHINVAALDRLNDILDKGINAWVPLDGEMGFDRQYTRYKKLKSNPAR